MAQKLTGQEKFFFFCLFLMLVTVGFILYFWGGNNFYSQAYTPVVEQSREMRKYERRIEGALPPASKQPRPRGFKESEIEKQRGDRFSTY